MLLNYNSISDIRRKFIFDSKDRGYSRSYIFGYEKDNPSYEFLKTKIFGEESDIAFPLQETIYTKNLEYAKKFFKLQLASLDNTQIEIIYKRLTQNFLFNIYAISNEVDVFVAFETMNNRGKVLSHLELLKNRLIYLSTKFEADAHEKNNLREVVNEAWKSVYYFLGKNKLRPLDDDTFLYNHFAVLFSHWLNDDQKRKYLQQGYRLFSSPGRRLYQDYLLEEKFSPKNLKPTDGSTALTIGEIRSYVSSLKSSVALWYQILTPTDSDFSQEEIFWFEKLNRLSILSVAPLLLVFFQREKNERTRVRLLKAVERYLFVRSFVGGFRIITSVPRDLGQIESLKFISLMNETNGSEKVIKEFESMVDALVSDAPQIDLPFSQLSNGGFYQWRGIRYLLYEYELSLKEKTRSSRDKIMWDTFASESEEDYSTVEHIYPQSPKKPCWTDRFREYNDRQRRSLRNSLGNLVALSRGKNASLSNDCFVVKVNGREDTQNGGYRFGSYSEIEVSQYSDWTSKEIMARGLKMMSFIEKRWKMNLGDEERKLQLLGIEFLSPNYVASKQKKRSNIMADIFVGAIDSTIIIDPTNIY